VVGFSAHSTGLMASWPEEVSIGNMAFALSAVSTVDTGSTHYWTFPSLHCSTGHTNKPGPHGVEVPDLPCHHVCAAFV
jgi:hypothetical protein